MSGTFRFTGPASFRVGVMGIALSSTSARGAVGAHVPIAPHASFALAYERPFSHQKEILEQRVTTSLVLEF